jgi:hypothetical protein
MKTKSGISLIAVLMFMLAATTASVVVFKWIGSENFSSAARLKQSEAYQASESGLDAVQAWLTNKAGDAGEVLHQYQYENNKKPILLTDTRNNVLGTVGGSRSQSYKVYLTNADLNTNGRKKLEFLSIGTARDGSKVSQKAIFSVDGLYQITIQVPPPTSSTISCQAANCDFDYAFFGGIDANTQGRFSSAVINGDFKADGGISTNKTLIVTGNMEVQDNGKKNIGCKEGSESIREGDLYVVGYWKARGFTVCGNAYIGGLLSNENNQLKFLGHLYADGGIESRGFRVDSNVTLGGNLTFGNNEKLDIKGNFVMEKYILDNKGALTATTKTPPKIVLSGDPKMEIGGNFWSYNDNPAFSGTASNNGYDNLKYLGGSGKSLLIPGITKCSATPNTNLCNNTSLDKRYYQSNPSAYFSSNATQGTPSNTNKPIGANPLPELASKITPCKNKPSSKCVPDPLEVPEETKKDWSKRGKLLDSLVNANSLTDLPSACIRLVLKKEKFVGNDSEDKGLGSHWGARNNKGKNFVLSANECYANLLKSDPKKILFPEGSTEKFLVVRVVNTEQASPENAFDGNFIFVFESDMSKPMYLPATTDVSNVFIYLKEGATGDMPLNSSCQSPAKSPCKRNYFIFSEKNIAGSSGNATINGAIFLASGAKVTNKLPDAEIEFNSVLYDALKQAGAVSMTQEYMELLGGSGGGGGSSASSTGSSSNSNPDVNDSRYIPVASRLLVKLETKDISTNPEPRSPEYVKPTILVMPRLVLLDIDEISSFKNNYSYMLMNNVQGSGKTQPTCLKVGEESSSLYDNEAKVGIYKCTVPSDDKISEFYVQLSTGEVEVSIRTSTNLIKKGESSLGCATVSLSTNKPPPSAFTVNVVVEPGTGNGWKCNGSACSGPYPHQINTQGSSNILTVCPMNNDPENNSIVLSLRGENISKTNNKVTINFGSGATGKIKRNTNYGIWKDCPSQYMPTGTWVDVACEGKKTTNANNEWECELGSLATWNIIATGDACKTPNGASDNGGPFTISESMTSFDASLEWKKYNLTVSDGQVALLSPTTGQGTIPCNTNCGDTIYHNGNYEVKSSTLYGYCINRASSCAADNVDGIVGPGTGESFILNPTAKTTIKLTAPPAKSITCILNKTTIKKGQNLSDNDFTVTFIGGCNPTTYSSFQFRPKNSPSLPVSSLDIGKHDIEAMHSGCSSAYITCTNQLTVESDFGCDYQPSFCGGAAIASVLDNTAAAPTNAGQCLFISNFNVIQPDLNSTVAINGIENACGSANSCPNNTKPLTKDGGYYVYLKTGRINTYNNNGWKNIVSGTKSTACTPATPPTNSCLTHPLTPYGTKPADPFNTCLKKNNECYQCNPASSSKDNCDTDWFWGGDNFLGVQWVNDGWLTKIPCPASSSYTPWCRISGCKVVQTDIPPPEYGCVSGITVLTNAKFNYTSANHSDVSQNKPSGWNQEPPNKHKFPNSPGTDRDVYMWEINCDGNNITLGSEKGKDGILCGTIDLASSCNTVVTANCNLAKTSVTQGENIGRPTITCSNSAEPSGAVFTATGATNAASNWDGQNNGYAYYSNSGEYNVSVSVNCGSTALNNVNCGTIKVEKPTCTSPPGTDGNGSYTLIPSGNGYNVNVPPPTFSCGRASAKNAKFNVTGASGNGTPTSDLKWNSTPPGNHGFYNEGDGRVIRMYEIYCDEHQLTYGNSNDKAGIQCTNPSSINIKPAATSSCGAGSTSGSADSAKIGNCLDLTNSCTKNNNLPLKIFNDTHLSTTLNGTIYCSDNSFTSISCSNAQALCNSNACPAGTTSAYLYITNVSRTGTIYPKMRSNCW